MTKILHLIDSISFGGAQLLLKNYFEYEKSNKDIFLFALRKRDFMVKIKHQNIMVFKSNSKYSFFPIIKIIKLVNKYNIDVLHCHLFRSQVFGWIVKKIFFPKLKLVFHEHGEILQNNPLFNIFFTIAKHDVNLFIAVSKAIKNEMKKRNVPIAKIFLLFNFIELNKFKPKNKSIKKKSNSFNIGFIGRLSKVKGADFLIKELPKLKFDYTLLVIGDGQEKQNLINLVKTLNLSKKVIFLGYQKNIQKLYEKCDVIVIPSIAESFGLVALEANSIGIPVIAANVPGLNEVIINNVNGLLFERNVSGKLASKICMIKKNKTLSKKLILNGYKNAKEFSNLPDYAHNLEVSYNEI